MKHITHKPKQMTDLNYFNAIQSFLRPTLKQSGSIRTTIHSHSAAKRMWSLRVSEGDVGSGRRAQDSKERQEFKEREKRRRFEKQEQQKWASALALASSKGEAMAQLASQLESARLQSQSAADPSAPLRRAMPRYC